jgi:hypothetical protein
MDIQDETCDVKSLKDRIAKEVAQHAMQRMTMAQ